ncbi:MAG: hypothetical protein JOZ42_12105 [Acetobacteraceae bacterium]|nr:hypothetical protein [Acetobacteraceae bacterium]
MSLPIPVPDWVPWWVPLALLVPCLLYALALLFMPFSVIGMKSRLEAIEARLDEIQGEIRSLSLRMPERPARSHFDELYTAPMSSPDEPRNEPVYARPPIPPAPRYVEEPYPPAGRTDEALPRRTAAGGRDPGRRTAQSDRSEPHLDWPP